METSKMRMTRASSTRFFITLATGLLILVTTLSASKVHAEEEAIIADVIELDARATEAFGVENFEEALASLRAAQLLVPAAPRLYNMAMCLERLGRYNDAVDLYEQYLAADDESVSRIDEARRRVLRLREHVSSPSHEEGESDGVDESSQTTGERRRLAPAPFYSMLAVTAAAGVAVAVLGGATLARHNDFQSRYSDEAGYTDDQSTGQSLALATDVMLGVTLTSAVVTIILAIFTRFQRSEEQSTNASPRPSLSLAGLDDSLGIFRSY